MDEDKPFSSIGRLLVNLLINGLAVFIAAYILPGVAVEGFLTAILTAIILGVVNTLLKPLLIILTLPITIVTLGLFLLVINAGLVMLVGAIVPGFSVAGLPWALLFSVVLSLVSGFLESLQD